MLAAVMTPPKPDGANGCRFADLNPWMPMAMNMTSTTSLIATMTAFVFADSLTPRISSSAHITMRIMAGRLNIPPCSGALDNALGIWTPNRLSSNWLTYCDQPTAVAAPATPHSSSRQAPTPTATTSPRVV